MNAAVDEGPGVSGGLMQRMWGAIVNRTILLLLLFAFMTVALIGVVGISTSVVVVESVRGSASAINAAGSLRRLSQRAGGLAVARGSAAAQQDEVEEAIDQFEAGLMHRTLRDVLEREPSSVFSSILRGIEASWYARIKPHLLEIPSPDRKSVV